VFTVQQLERAFMTRPAGLRHAALLARADARMAELDGSQRGALGAYLVARLMDRMVGLTGAPCEEQGFRWQSDHTAEYVASLSADDADAEHLARIVGATRAAPAERLAAAREALSTYADHLERAGRFDQALDVERLVGLTWRQGIPPGEFTSLALTIGRLNRHLGRAAPAGAAYDAAVAAAAQAGDGTAAIRARLGQAAAWRLSGDVAAAEREVCAVIELADADPELQSLGGLALAELGAIHAARGRPVPAVRALLEAVPRFTDVEDRLRTLGELGWTLALLGEHEAADAAFRLVETQSGNAVLRARAALGLMELASQSDDQVGFQRWRLTLLGHFGALPPLLQVEFRYREGAGLARFDRPVRARAAWRDAAVLARMHELPTWSGHVSHALEQLGVGAPPAMEPAPSPEVTALADDLRALVALARA
jgi:hypothetical protein